MEKQTLENVMQMEEYCKLGLYRTVLIAPVTVPFPPIWKQPSVTTPRVLYASV